MKRTRAFTLIELLVVIAIIAILLSILLPSLKKVKEQAKRLRCGSRQKSVGTALALYADACDGWIPPQFVWYKDKPMDDAQWRDELPWQSYLCVRNNNLDEPLHLAALIREGLLDDARIFYCVSQYKMRLSGYQRDYTYEYYTDDGRYEWGTWVPTDDVHIRASYNYWNYNQSHMNKIHPSKPILVDNLQHYDVVPHRKNAETPLGVNALYADSHVTFCAGEDLFEERLWNPQGDWNWERGPGNNRPEFDEIMRRLIAN